MTPPPTVLHWPGGGGSWDPSQLSSVAAWYDADAITGLSNNDPVSTWADASGNGYNLTQTSTKRPTYKTSTLNGLPVIEFDGTDDYLAASTAADWTFLHDSTGSSLFVVLKAGTSANPNAAYAALGTHSGTTTDVGINLLYDDRSSLSRNDRMVSLVNNGSGSFFVLNVSSDDAFDANTYGLVSVVSDPANTTLADRSSIYVNGGTAITNNSTSGSLSTSNPTYALHVGSQGNGNSKLLGGIAEVVICDAVLTSTDREKLEGYLAHKWGLTANLPVSHPYKSSAP